jgi:hypothetical protein
MQIESSRGRALADEYGMKFFEVSAKDGTAVAESFNVLARDVVAKMMAMGATTSGGGGGGDGTAAGPGGVKVLKDGKKGGGDKDNCVVM